MLPMLAVVLLGPSRVAAHAGHDHGHDHDGASVCRFFILATDSSPAPPLTVDSSSSLRNSG